MLFDQRSIPAFFNRLFEKDLFECAVIAAKGESIFRKHEAEWPKVIVSADDARSARLELERRASSGFSVIVGAKIEIEDLKEIFFELGYREAGTTTFASGDQHDPLSASFDKTSFKRAVEVAAKLCATTLCVFSHDGDPVYLLRDSRVV